MSTTIESLELEIKSNSTSAESGIKNLTASLEKLKSATKGGLGLKAVATQIGAVSNAVNSIQADSVNKMSGLASAIQMLSGVKISPTIAKNLSGITSAINGMSIDSNATTKIQELITTLQPLYDLPKQNFSSVVTAIKNIPKALTALNEIDMDAFKTKVLEVTEAVRPLATEMNKVAAGFASFPSKIQKLISSNENLVRSNKKTASSFTDLYHMGQVVINTIVKIGQTIYKFIDKASDYIENVNLFEVAMGSAVRTAKDYADNMSEAMGIDSGEWMKNQGLFQTLITGFGVAGDSAALMSQNLTQLAYDLSSFYNIDVETAMQKLKSGMAGELEPLRAIGYDLSQAKLEATAAELGIDKAVSSMTQAEKSMLRYYAIMTQVTTSHGDMARTLEQPANQMRILKAQLEMLGREIGNVFLPLLEAVLPYLISIVKVAREIVSAIAILVGYEPPELGDSGVEELASGSEDMSNSLENANEEAKKLKNYMMGFDELNVINPSDESDTDDKKGVFDIDLPDMSYTDDFFDNLIKNSPLNDIIKKMKEWLGITGDIDSWSDIFETRLGRILTSVGLIAAGMLAWKLGVAFVQQLDNISIALGAMLLIDSVLVTFQEGLSWESVLTGALGGALAGAGIGFKLGGWTGAVGGIIIGIGLSLIINGITSMIEEGVDVENVLTTIAGVLTTIGGIVTVVKLFNLKNKTGVQDFDTAGKTIGDVSTGMSNMTAKLKNLATNLAWGLVILVEVAAAAILVVGAIAILGWELEQVGIAWQPVIDNAGTVAIAMGIGTALLVAIGVVTALLGSVGATLVASMALGVAILALLGVAAALFIAEIIVVGVLLEQVGIAWKPVLDNGETITNAILIGTGLLVGIGVVAALLGVAAVATVGMLPLAIALGTLMLLELGIAAALFITEIIKIGELLEDVGVAWKPVLDNGKTISEGIQKGTGLLIDIGIVSAALGVASIATVGLLPLAIALGTAMLVQLGEAFITFTDNIVIVAKQLSDELHPALEKASEILPGLTTNMTDYTDFMGDFAGEMVKYSLDSAVAGIAGTISKVIGFFTGDPVEQMTAEVKSQKTQFDSLIKQLEDVIPKIKKAIELQSEYRRLMSEFGQGSGSGIGDAIGSFFGGIGDAIGSLFSRSTNTSTTVSVAAIPAYASGGFPESGQAFIARENGIPEMVGTIGRRAAVANNEQIVESVASGVAEANSEQNMLLREQNTLLRALLEKDSGVYLDGRSLSASVDKYKREQGRVLITGGVL